MTPINLNPTLSLKRLSYGSKSGAIPRFSIKLENTLQEESKIQPLKIETKNITIAGKVCG